MTAQWSLAYISVFCIKLRLCWIIRSRSYLRMFSHPSYERSTSTCLLPAVSVHFRHVLVHNASQRSSASKFWQRHFTNLLFVIWAYVLMFFLSFFRLVCAVFNQPGSAAAHTSLRLTSSDSRDMPGRGVMTELSLLLPWIYGWVQDIVECSLFK